MVERLLHLSQVVLKRENLDSKLCLLPGALSNEPAEGKDSFFQSWRQGYKTDPRPSEILALLDEELLLSKKISLAECSKYQAWLRF